MNRRLVKPRIGILRDIMEGSGRNLPISPTAVAMSSVRGDEALGLEHMLDRSVMPETALKQILANYFDSLTGRSPDINIKSMGTAERQ